MRYNRRRTQRESTNKKIPSVDTSVPTEEYTIAEIKEYLKSKGIDFKDREKKADLLALVV